jgi:hypothetical protein
MSLLQLPAVCASLPRSCNAGQLHVQPWQCAAKGAPPRGPRCRARGRRRGCSCPRRRWRGRQTCTLGWWPPPAARPAAGTSPAAAWPGCRLGCAPAGDEKHGGQRVHHLSGHSIQEARLLPDLQHRGCQPYRWTETYRKQECVVHESAWLAGRHADAAHREGDLGEWRSREVLLHQRLKALVQRERRLVHAAVHLQTVEELVSSRSPYGRSLPHPAPSTVPMQRWRRNIQLLRVLDHSMRGSRKAAPSRRAPRPQTPSGRTSG